MSAKSFIISYIKEITTFLSFIYNSDSVSKSLNSFVGFIEGAPTLGLVVSDHAKASR